jgi:hypothetical protein
MQVVVVVVDPVLLAQVAQVVVAQVLHKEILEIMELLILVEVGAEPMLLVGMEAGAQVSS